MKIIAGYVMMAVLAIAPNLRAAPLLEETVLWQAGTDGYHTYRIPALVVTAQGSVLAFCEGRKNGAGDHGDLDLLVKRSTDGGRTWSPQHIVHEEGGDAKITIGNPCPVVGAATGTIWLPFTRDNKAVFITRSTDDGVTWAEPADVSGDVTKPDWTWVATGPGVGIQLQRGGHKGRLVIPSDHKRKDAGGKEECNSHMMMSDDGGRTWRISAPIQTGGNECQVVERADGTLLVNTRMQGDYQGMRGTATSADGGATWTPIKHEPVLPCPKCEASLIALQSKDLAKPVTLLFSNPDGVKTGKEGRKERVRATLTLRLSEDEGLTWPVAKVLHAGPSAYSSLTELPDGTFLCLYEGGEKSFRETLRVAHFNRDWLRATRASSPSATKPTPP